MKNIFKNKKNNEQIYVDETSDCNYHFYVYSGFNLKTTASNSFYKLQISFVTNIRCLIKIIQKNLKKYKIIKAN